MTAKKSYKLTAALNFKKIPFPEIHYMFRGLHCYVPDYPVRQKQGRPPRTAAKTLAMIADIEARMSRPLRRGEATQLIEKIRKRHPKVGKTTIRNAINKRQSALSTQDDGGRLASTELPSNSKKV